MRSAQQAASQQQNTGQQGSQQSEADARRAAERLQEAKDMLGGMRKQQATSQLGELADRAGTLAAQQRDFSNRLRQTFGDQLTGNGRPQPGQGQQQMQRQSQQMADEKDKMAGDVEQLEKDMQKAARDMVGTQPAASGRVREALSELQQNEAKLRMKYSASNIRRGLGGYMVPREAPITETMDKVAEDLKAAQSALKDGNQQNNGHGDTERSLAQLERLRSQMERMAGRAQPQQGGQQQGASKAASNRAVSKRAGSKQAASRADSSKAAVEARKAAATATAPSSDPAATATATLRRTGNQYGRFMPEGMYNLPNERPIDPQRMMQDATRSLSEMRQTFKDDPDMLRQITDVEREISRLQVGDISSQELQNRLNREILPNLEALEVQLRRQADQEGGDQVRSGTTDKVPAGYADAVAEYFRKLGKSK